MLRFALGTASRKARESAGARSRGSCNAGAAEALGRGEALATVGTDVLARLASSSTGAGCGCTSAAGAGWRTRAATDTKPRLSPAAAAATIVQRDPAPRRETGAPDDSRELATNGASLGGGTDSITRGSASTGASAFGVGGVGIARSVVFSLTRKDAGSLGGGGGGKLERAIGIASESGASPPRTTTA